nr:putative reverse transcriptase domain-containing protein [Tanacetum cinerariifolium]
MCGRSISSRKPVLLMLLRLRIKDKMAVMAKIEMVVMEMAKMEMAEMEMVELEMVEMRIQMRMVEKGQVVNQKVVTCFKCGRQGHFRSDCPKLKDQNRRNKAGNKNGVGEAKVKHICWVEETLTRFKCRQGTLLDIIPDTLDVSYAVELADGRVSETNTVLRGCRLGLLGHPFNIDLMSVELGSFDVIIGIDWLANHHAVIICDEKIMRIPYGDNKEEHAGHLKLILELLKKGELYAKFLKCDFWLSMVQFLGHVIDSEGIHIAKPMTKVTQKNVKFDWSKKVEFEFQLSWLYPKEVKTSWFTVMLLVKGLKSYADMRRKPLEFEVGDKVMLKVSPWKGVIRFGKRRKLNPRYIRPFKILSKVGMLAYQLELLKKLIRVHNTFHVSNLKKCFVDEKLTIPLDEIQIEYKLNFIEEPVEIMDREVKRLRQSRIPTVKVRWNLRRGLEFTWEREDQIKKKYPHLFVNPSSTS